MTATCIHLLLSPSAALDVFREMSARGRFGAVVEGRSPGGYGHELTQFHPELKEVPLHFLDLVSHRWELRFWPVTRRCINGQADQLLAGFCIWHPQVTFGKETGWRHAVLPKDREPISRAIAGAAVPPSLLIDGGHEVVALWPLKSPLDLGDLPPCAELLSSIARPLGGDIGAAEEPANVSIPIGGFVRNWGSEAPAVQVFEVNGGRVFAAADLADAFGRER